VLERNTHASYLCYFSKCYSVWSAIEITFPSVCPSVCLSVCDTLQLWVIRWVLQNLFRPLTRPGCWLCSEKCAKIFTTVLFRRLLCGRCVTKLQFSTNISLCLRNDTTYGSCSIHRGLNQLCQSIHPDNADTNNPWGLWLEFRPWRLLCD